MKFVQQHEETTGKQNRGCHLLATVLHDINNIEMENVNI